MKRVSPLYNNPLQPWYSQRYPKAPERYPHNLNSNLAQPAAILRAHNPLLRWTIRRSPGVIIFRQHKFLHMSTSDSDIPAVKNRQYHGRVQQVPEWLIRVVCASARLYQQILWGSVGIERISYMPTALMASVTAFVH